MRRNLGHHGLDMDTNLNENKKTKILAITGFEILVTRGTRLRVKRLLESLAERSDIELRVVSTDSISPISGAEHIQVKSGFFGAFFQIYKSLKKNKADVIIGHTILSLKHLFLLRFLFKSKLFLEVHGFNAEEAYQDRSIGWFRYHLNRNIHKVLFYMCDLITTSSPTATSIVSKYNKNSYTVFNSVDVDLFTPEVEPNFNFKENPDEIVIGYAGNTSEYQGLAFLISSFKKLIVGNKKYKLALLLSNEQKGVIKRDGSIVTLGRIPHAEVPGFLASCDILVVPRPDDPICRISFPSKIIEYMAMGKPVLASNVGDVGKIVKTGENGVLYSPGDETQFLEAIEVLSSPVCRFAIGLSARKTIVDTYTNTNTQNFFYSLVKSLTI